MVDNPVFVLSSGRSGTYQVFELLKSINYVDVDHERLFEPMLAAGVERFMGMRNEDFFAKTLGAYTDIVRASDKRVWLDISNAIPWMAESLYANFPKARFVNLVRDGRKVVISFFRKFHDDMYDPDAVTALRAYLDGTGARPDNRKRFWRPLPEAGFVEKFDSDERFANLCFYWSTVIRHSAQFMDAVPATQKMTLKFEEFVGDEAVLRKFLNFVNIDFCDVDVSILSRPVNVAIPQNFGFEGSQQSIFEAVCGEDMLALGYKKDNVYEVEY
jgi:hypothetical protein